VFTGASVTPRARPPSNSSALLWDRVNAMTASRVSSSEWASAPPVRNRASYVAQSSAAAHSRVTTPLSTIHGISPTSVAEVAMSTTSPSAHG
jgi:hypothetical protein